MDLIKLFSVLGLKRIATFQHRIFLTILYLLVNNLVFIVFWYVISTVTPVFSEEVAFTDTILILAVVTYAFGLTNMFAPELGTTLARLVYSGGLDSYLTLPQNPFYLLLLTRLDVVAFSEVLLGFAFFAFSQQPSFSQTVLFVIVATIAAANILILQMFIGSLTFFLGNGEHLAKLYMGFLQTIAIYPLNVLGPYVVVILHTIMPVVLISYLPFQILSSDPVYPDYLFYIGGYLLLTGILGFMSYILFKVGLRRYESGNLFTQLT